MELKWKKLIRILIDLIYWFIIYKYVYCRTLYGCVDWNGYQDEESELGNAYMGAWIETSGLIILKQKNRVAPYMSA